MKFKQSHRVDPLPRESAFLALNLESRKLIYPAGFSSCIKRPGICLMIFILYI